jgi:F-type H+-transporting ATPase subunit b
MVTFGLAVLVLWRFFWKPLVRFMDKRRRDVETDLEAARSSRTEAEELQRRLSDQVAEIDKKANLLLELATEEGTRRREEILREAQAEARRLLEDARRHISEEKARAARELRAETVALSMLIAERALRQSVDPKVQERLVGEFVEELKNA